jgi:hypothetical protein
MSYWFKGDSGTGHTRLSFRVMSVRRAGLSVTGDKREEVERRAGRNILPERKDMMEVWVGSSGLASAIVNLYGLRSMPLRHPCITNAPRVIEVPVYLHCFVYCARFLEPIGVCCDRVLCSHMYVKIETREARHSKCFVWGLQSTNNPLDSSNPT